MNLKYYNRCHILFEYETSIWAIKTIIIEVNNIGGKKQSVFLIGIQQTQSWQWSKFFHILYVPWWMISRPPVLIYKMVEMEKSLVTRTYSICKVQSFQIHPEINI